MSIPSFTSVEEADAWLAQQAREKRKAEVEQEIKSCKGPVWITKRGRRVLYSTAPLASGKFGVVVFEGDFDSRALYVREFVRRKDAKEKAFRLYVQHGGRP